MKLSPCRNFSSSCGRWHKDLQENKHEYRYGFKDRVMFTGPLPRLTNVAEPIRAKETFRPDNPFAPSEVRWIRSHS